MRVSSSSLSLLFSPKTKERLQLTTKRTNKQKELQYNVTLEENKLTIIAYNILYPSHKSITIVSARILYDDPTKNSHIDLSYIGMNLKEILSLNIMKISEFLMFLHKSIIIN